MLGIGSTSFVRGDEIEVTGIARDTIVAVNGQYVDRNINIGGDVALKNSFGSGFVVTDNGYIVTALHVVEAWLSQTEDQKQNHPVQVSLVDNEHWQSADVLPPFPHVDIAVLKLKGHHHGLKAAPICFLPEEPVEGTRWLVFGFPESAGGADGVAGFNGMGARFSNADNPNSGWQLTTDATYGVSGGPVFDIQGRVLAVMRQGTGDNVNFATPLRRAKALLENTFPVTSACDGKPAPSPTDSTCTTEQYFVGGCGDK